MFIELIDLLRCTRPHEDSWLVATFHEMRERKVIEGLLGCPVCGARYAITRGTAYFDVSPDTEARRGAGTGADAVRAAAYLNLVEPGIVAVQGAWGSAADGLAALGNTVIALNSEADDTSVSHIMSNGALPVARESMDGVALDITGDELVQSAAAALKNGARLIAPVSAEMPRGLAELARDERYWVAAKEGARTSAPIQIARR